MKSLYLRIWLTVVAALALFAGVSGWIVQRHLADERRDAESQLIERMTPWAELLQNSLPAPGAPDASQAEALNDWSDRLHLPLALDDAQGRRIATSTAFSQRERAGDRHQPVAVPLDDGRKLWMMRPQFDRGPRTQGPLSDGGPRQASGPEAGGPLRDGGPFGDGGPLGGPPGVPLGGPPGGPPGALPGGPDGGPNGGPNGGPHLGPSWHFPFLVPKEWPAGVVLASLLALLFLAVAGGAWPIVRGLTRRLEQLRQGVEAFGTGDLRQRVVVQGHDEVAAVAASFNQAAERIEALVTANQSLLANASHELRSPLARLKMAVTMLDDAPVTMRESLAREINTNIAELDALVEEVLLSSRLEAGAPVALDDQVPLLALGAEEAARTQAEVSGEDLTVRGSERLLRRAVRNLLENGRRYGGGQVELQVSREGGQVRLCVCDRGPGVPADLRERIFEPFYRMPGHAEREGGVGLGLALVRQIAQAHGGSVRCEPREGGGTCFVIRLPASVLVS